MSQRSESELTRVDHPLRSDSNPQVDCGSTLPLTARPGTGCLHAAHDRPTRACNMIRTRWVLSVITGLCVFGMSSPLLATCNDNPECDDGFQCTLDLCTSGVCVHFPVDASCDDGLFCTGVEVCAPAPGGPVTGCVDGTNPCAVTRISSVRMPSSAFRSSRVWTIFSLETGLGAVAGDPASMRTRGDSMGSTQ